MANDLILLLSYADTMFSEDVREVETTVRHVEDRLFYTETFHCAAWLYRGDDVSPAESPRVLSKRPRPVNSMAPTSSIRMMSLPVYNVVSIDMNA